MKQKKWGSELLNDKFILVISFHEGFYLCSYVTNYVLCCLRMWRTSFVLFSTIFNMIFKSYIWWTPRQYEGFGFDACVNWHLDEDTQHLEMSKKAHAHSPQLSNKILKSIRTAKETGLVEARENHHLYAASRRDPDWRSLRGLPKKGNSWGSWGRSSVPSGVHWDRKSAMRSSEA